MTVLKDMSVRQDEINQPSWIATSDEGVLNIILYSIPEWGHVFPLVKIGAVLRRKGHRVVFAISEYYAEKLKKFESFLEIVPLKDGVTAEEEQKQLAKHPFAVWEHHGAVARTALKEAIFAQPFKPDCMIADFTSFAGFEVAVEMGNIWPVLCSCPIPLQRARNARPTFLHLFTFAWRDIPHKLWMRYQALCGNPMALAFKRVAMCMRGNMLLVHSEWCIDFPHLVPPLITMIGVLPNPISQASTTSDPWEGHEDVRDWIDRDGEQRDIVYVSTGSWVKLTSLQVNALAVGLQSEHWRTIWSLRDEYHAELPAGMLDNPDVLIRPWLPQEAILSHPAVKVMLTHCGWGGLTEVLIEGKPVVAMPFVGDQPTNACLVEERGLGVKLDTPRITPKSVQAAVVQVMFTKSYATNASRVGHILQIRARSSVLTDTVETLARCGDGHLQLKVDILDDSQRQRSHKKAFLFAAAASAGLFLLMRTRAAN